MKKVYVRKKFHAHPLLWRLVAVGLVVVGLPVLIAVTIWREWYSIWGEYREFVDVAFKPWADSKEDAN